MLKDTHRNIRFSRLGLGTLTIGPFQRNFPIDEGANIIIEAVRRGINVIDTADYYKTYPYIKKALEVLSPQEKENLTIMSRSYDYTYEGMEKNFDKALREMGVSRIPIFMLHEMESEHTLRGHAPALDFLVDKKREGLIDLTGISTHYIRAVKAAADHPLIDCIFAILNKKGLGIMDGTSDEMEKALEYAYNRGKLVFIMKALGGGHLFREREMALSYSRDLPFAHCVVVGMQSVEEIEYNLSIFQNNEDNNRHFDKKDETISRLSENLDERERKLLIEDYCRGCGNCRDACPFKAISIINKKAVVDYDKCMLCSYCAMVCPDFCIKVI